MKYSLFQTAVFSLLAALLPLTAQEVPTQWPFWTCAWCKDFRIGTRPSDAKGHEGVDYDLWLQVADGGPKNHGKEFRIKPIPFPGREGGKLDVNYLPDGLVAPDARWVAFSQKSCRGYAVAYVLQRDEAKGFIPMPKLVSEMGWDEFFKENPDQAANRGEMSGITRLSESSICDLVAWEPDSSAVWFSLRGGDRRDAGIYHWYFLWETKTGKVVVPERVKAINKQAAARWSSDENPLSKDAAAAEEQHYVFLAELKSRLEKPILTVSKNTLDHEARIRFDRFRNVGQGGAAKTLKGYDARELIDGQRSALFDTALKTGAVATLECP